MEINVKKIGENYYICYNENKIEIKNKNISNIDVYNIFKDKSKNEINNITYAKVNSSLDEIEQNMINEIYDILFKIQNSILEIDEE